MKREFTTAQFRDVLLQEEKCLEVVPAFVQVYFEHNPLKTRSSWSKQLVRRSLRMIAETNVRRIHLEAESPIEKIFLCSLALSSIYVSPLPLIVTPRHENVTEAVAVFRQYHEEVIALREDLGENPQKYGETSFPKLLERHLQSGSISHDEKMQMMAQDIAYEQLGLKNAYHLTPQAGFPDIEVDGSSIRPDLFIWKPNDETVRLLVECDGYKYHSDKVSFTKDRKRDRALQAADYDVMRFSGTEIFHEPMESAAELLGHLLTLDDA